jgi:two-component system, NarL family, invasion response regulator UvrY
MDRGITVQYSPMLSVLIADDHALIRKGLVEILRSARVPAVVGEASTAQEALALSRTQAWDVIVLDISLPDGSGVQTLARLKQEAPERPVIMHSMHDNAVVIRRCLALGASGYVLKEAAAEELLIAIEAVLNGETYLSSGIPPLTLAPTSLPGTAPDDTLPS